MTMDMTQGRPTKLLLRFAVPLMLSAMLQQMYTLCDSFIIGRLLGTVAFTATASASNVNWFPLHILLGAIQGFSVALAQRFGARHMDDFHRYFGASITLSLGLGLAFSGIGLVFADQFLILLKTPVELTDYALRYLRVLWMGFPLTALLNIFNSTLLAMGDSRTPLVALTASSFVNILLDILFIAWLKLGVEGAALATLIAQGFTVWISFLSLRKAGDVLPKAKHFALRRDALQELLRLGSPRMLCNGVTTSGELLVQAAINSWGVAFVTGLTVSHRDLNLLNIIGYGLEGAVATFVGQNWGAGRVDRVRQGTRNAVALGLVTSIATGSLVCLFAEPMIRFFAPDGTIEAITYGVEALRVMAIFLPGLYLLCEYRAAIQGMGNSVIPMWSGFLELAMRIGCTLLLPQWIGQKALYFTDGAAWAATMAMLMFSYYFLQRTLSQNCKTH